MKHMIRNEQGALVLVTAVLLMVVTGAMYMFASQQMGQISYQYKKTQTMAFAHQISASLAQRLRWSYDIAQSITKNPANGPLCSGSGLSIETVGTLQLCLQDKKACVKHPGNTSTEICIVANDSLFAKKEVNSHSSRKMLALLLLSHRALASPYEPPAPILTDTDNNLTQAPTCLGGSCEVRCGRNPGDNADCLTFSYCPVASGNCSPEDRVFQTIAFFY